MQTGKRGKPHRNHVRTGCITCKNRRVKCPEERPHCSRCIKGGFVCAGYAIPKAWIFKSSAETQTETDDAYSKSSSHSPSTGSGTSVSLPYRKTGSTLFSTSISSPLQLGNSDPFKVLPIRLGPRETYFLRIYQELVRSRFGRPQSRYTIHLPAASDWTNNGICLEDEAAAYSLLARSAALHDQRLNGPRGAPSIFLMNYVTMTQASLHRKLALLDGFETPEMVCAIMWASGLLAFVDMVMGSPNMHLHSRAMSRLIVRYVELSGDDVQLESFLYFLYIDILRSLLTMTRPMVDMIDWFPRLCQNMWSKAAALYPIVKSATSDRCIHQDVKDEVIRGIVLSQREDGHSYVGLQDTKMNNTEIVLVGNSVRTQELSQYGQVLNTAIDAMECLKKSVSTSEQVIELIQDQIARVYIAFAMLLWMSLTSPTSFATIGALDPTPGLLRRLRMVIIKSQSHLYIPPDQDESYALAKLWVLYVGVQTEYWRKIMLRTDPVCGDWFFEAFRRQAEAMRICSWQHAVTFLQQILYSDHMTPHISEWWQQYFSVS